MGERAADGDRPPSFSLTPLESVLVGIRLRGERLAIGPSGADRLIASLVAAVAVAVGAALGTGGISLVFDGETVAHPAAPVVAGWAVVAGGVVAAASVALRCVRADGAGLRIRTLAGTRRVPWSKVHEIRSVVRHHPTAWRGAPGGLGRTGDGALWLWQRRPFVQHWQLGQVALRDGSTIELWGVRSPHRIEGYVGVRELTTAEHKVNLLRRYHSAATAHRPSGQPDPPALVVIAPPSLWWQPCLGVVVLWLAWALSSWAVGAWRDPIVPVLASVLCTASAALARSIRRRGGVGG